jgi:hypothetical protein
VILYPRTGREPHSEPRDPHVPGTGLEMTAYRRGWHVLLPEEGTRDRAGGHLVLTPGCLHTLWTSGLHSGAPRSVLTLRAGGQLCFLPPGWTQLGTGRDQGAT